MPLDVARPASVKAAAAMLAGDPSARLVGGGTIVVRVYGAGDLSIGRLVLSDDLGLGGIRIEAGRAVLGAAATMADILARSDLAFLHGVALEIGGPAIRAMATVGGNLFARAPYGDLAVALLALGAEVSVEGPDGGETIDLERFLKERRANRRVVTEVRFAMPPDGSFRFAKVTRRHPHGASVLAIAALLPSGGGRLEGVRIAYGGMAPQAVRARAVERVLEGKPLDAAAVDAAMAVATKGTEPQDDPFASGWYRTQILPVHLGRLLKR